MNMFKKIKVNLVYFNMHKSHFSTLTFFFIDLALISLYFRVVLIFSSFLLSTQVFCEEIFNRVLLNIKLNENFCLCETLQVLYVISAPISPIFSKQENRTFDLVSLAIVLCTCPLWASSLFERYCYDVLIVVWHKSSIDQLIFTHWKRLTQLSKQFFYC